MPDRTTGRRPVDENGQPLKERCQHGMLLLPSIRCDECEALWARIAEERKARPISSEPEPTE